jgi:flagellar export protein FliJ
MAQFKFRLDTVLRQRELEETVAQSAVAEARRKVVAIEEELRDLQGQSDAAAQWMSAGRHLQGPINLQTLAAHRRYLNSVATVGGDKVRRLALAQRDVETARQRLAEAARRRKAIETLRDKQEQQWRTDRRRREDAAADEAATQMTFAKQTASTPIGLT